MQCTVPLKGKLTVPRSSILDPRFSKTLRIEARVEFRDVREFIETVREFIESGFETFEYEKKGLFARLTFDTSES